MTYHSTFRDSASIHSLLVGDMVQDLDLSYERTAALFCSALHALMKALARWFPSTCSRTSTSASSNQSSGDQEDLSIRQFLLNYRKQKELAEGIGIEDDDTEDRATSTSQAPQPGEYVICVRFGGEHIPSSPFQVAYWKELRQTSSCNRAKCPNSPGYLKPQPPVSRPSQLQFLFSFSLLSLCHL
ncbi:unnamed protein product [Oreochromis niloticus]|nr:unnamed protein product [Mustela putorius furo]